MFIKAWTQFRLQGVLCLIEKLMEKRSPADTPVPFYLLLFTLHFCSFDLFLSTENSNFMKDLQKAFTFPTRKKTFPASD